MTDSFLKLLAGRAVQTAATGGASSDINYIANFNAETDTSGWATYADAAAATPADGTGGSPNVTWTRSTSSPLRGTANFLFTKDAANRQGQGASYAFTIDRADQAKVLNISFDYEIASGTYSGGNDSTNSDLVAYVYDVTNAQVIQATPFKLNGAVSGVQYRFSASFQTASNSTSYRLILHVATTSASAYTVKFDNFALGPTMVIGGSPITNWVAYTPTIVGFGTPTNVVFASRRVGSNLEIQGSFTSGTSTATTATVSLGFNGINGGVAAVSGSPLDPSNYNRVGGWTSTGATGGELAMIIFTNQIALRFGHAQIAVSAAGSPMNGDAIVSTGQVVTIQASIPINGWSSNVQMSSDTDSRIVAAKYTNSSSQSLGDTNPINFANKIIDTHGAVTTGTGWQFLCPMAGVYEVSARIATSGLTPGAIGQRVILDIRVNGTRVAVVGGDVGEQTSTSREVFAGGSTLINLNAGDTVAVFFNSNLTGTLNANGDHNQFSIHRLAGPSLVMANEFIGVRAEDQSGASIGNNSNTVVNFATETYDTHSAFNTSNGTFTAPVRGYYQVNTCITFVNFASGGFHVRHYIRKNGSTHAFLEYSVSNGDNEDFGSNLNDLIFLNAGETISASIEHNSGSSRTLRTTAGKNFISIAKVG